MIKKYVLFGERCSGTTYLDNIMIKNFDIDRNNFGNKHFFGFQSKEKFKNASDTLFICIVRDLFDWLNSFYLNPHHLPEELKLNTHNFLNNCFHNKKCKKYKKIINFDLNIYTNEKYKNIFELRHVKLKWMIEDLPNLVSNYIFIKYEDLRDNFENTMIDIKNKGLIVKEGINFPENSEIYKNNSEKKFVKKIYTIIPREVILNNENLIDYYEKKLGYI